MSLGHLCWDNTILDLVKMKSAPSPETQGQIKGARESLNGRKKFSGTNQKPERRRPFGTGLVRHCPQRLFSPFFTFLHAIFFQPFRLSLAPTICPWVSEDEGDLSWPSLSMKKTQLLCKWALELKAVLYLSADLYLIAQTVRGNHDWNSRDRRGQMFFPLPAVAASVLSFWWTSQHNALTRLPGCQ